MNIEDIKFVSEIAKDAATAVGIIIGGSWALWKWQFSETLRRKHDEVSIEGNIIVSVHPFSNNKNLVSLVSVWKNMTKISVEVDCKDTFIEVFSLKNPKSEGYYHVDTDLHKATSDAYPFEGIRSLFLGPITTSRFNAHFVLPSDAIYIIRWNLMKTQATDEEWQRTWSKTIVVDLINPQSVNISE